MSLNALLLRQTGVYVAAKREIPFGKRNFLLSIGKVSGDFPKSGRSLGSSSAFSNRQHS
jgi:hypothetical protein